MFNLSERTLTFGYILALSLIAFFSIASYLTLDRVFQEHQGSAAVVNASGRQRMLSQRIASLAAQHALGDPSAKRDLLAAIDLFEAAHRHLVEGDPELFLPASNSPELQAIYFDAPDPLNRAVAAYAARARRIADTEMANPTLPAELGPLFAAAKEPLLQRLEAVVSIHQGASEHQLARLQSSERIMLLVVLLTLLVEAVAIFRPMIRRIAGYASDLLHLATTDGLTGLLNRRCFLERGQQELEQATRHSRPLTLMMLDADHFKQVNETFGHAGGDAVLRAFADYLSASVRSSDLVGRLGEEFAVLLPETDLAVASGMAERLRTGIAALVIFSEGRRIAFTVSIGVVAAGFGGADLQRLLNDADTALYAAKAAGRNRVTIGNASGHCEPRLEGLPSPST